jgi:hypothetical protein
MDDRLKTLGVFAAVGASLGAGVAIGLGFKVLAWGAAFGIGGGLAIGLAAEAGRRRDARDREIGQGERAWLLD